MERWKGGHGDGEQRPSSFEGGSNVFNYEEGVNVISRDYAFRSKHRTNADGTANSEEKKVHAERHIESEKRKAEAEVRRFFEPDKAQI